MLHMPAYTQHMYMYITAHVYYSTCTYMYITEKTLEHAMTRKQFGKELIVFDMIQHKFSKMAVSIYAMESMAYMTAGVIDAYQKPDASLEAALVKVGQLLQLLMQK